MHLENEQKRYGLYANHRDMCRFRDGLDQNWLSVGSSVVELVSLSAPARSRGKSQSWFKLKESVLMYTQIILTSDVKQLRSQPGYSGRHQHTTPFHRLALTPELRNLIQGLLMRHRIFRGGFQCRLLQYTQPLRRSGVQHRHTHPLNYLQAGWHSGTSRQGSISLSREQPEWSNGSRHNHVKPSMRRLRSATTDCTFLARVTTALRLQTQRPQDRHILL